MGVFASLVLAVDRQQPVTTAQGFFVETAVVGVDVSPVAAAVAGQQLGGVYPVALHTLDGTGGGDDRPNGNSPWEGLAGSAGAGTGKSEASGTADSPVSST